MTSTSGTGRLAISAKTPSIESFDASVNSSLPSTKYNVNCAGAEEILSARHRDVFPAREALAAVMSGVDLCGAARRCPGGA